MNGAHTIFSTDFMCSAAGPTMSIWNAIKAGGARRFAAWSASFISGEYNDL